MLGLYFLPCTRDRKHFVVKQLFYPECYLDVAAAVTPLARLIFLRRKNRKLSLPVTKHMCLYAAKLTDLTDLKVNFLRYYNRFLCHRRGDYVLRFLVKSAGVIVCI